MRRTSISKGRGLRDARAKVVLVTASLVTAATGLGLAGAGAAFAQSPASSAATAVRHVASPLSPSSRDRAEAAGRVARERAGSPDRPAGLTSPDGVSLER